jgi:hypothetical protein
MGTLRIGDAVGILVTAPLLLPWTPLAVCILPCDGPKPAQVAVLAGTVLADIRGFGMIRRVSSTCCFYRSSDRGPVRHERRYWLPASCRSELFGIHGDVEVAVITELQPCSSLYQTGLPLASW